MAQFFLKTSLLRQKIKPRYFLIPFTLITLLIVLPALINSNPDWVPIGSVNDTGLWGYSDIYATADEYSIEVSTTPLQERTDLFDRNTLLVLNSPERDITTEERDLLQRRIERGYSTLFVGPQTSGESRLMSMLSFAFFFGDQIYDTVNNGGFAAAPSVVSVERGDEQGMDFIAITPIAITSYLLDYEGFGDALIVTKDTAKTSQCLIDTLNQLRTDCNDISTIAAKNGETIVLADTWMMRNNFTTAYPQNLGVLNFLLNNFNNPIEKIIVDETHLDWAPVNQVGLSIFGYQLLNNEFYLGVFVVLGALLPTAIALYSGGISFQEFISKQRLTQRIGQRLNAIHISKVPAVPLSLEEKILVNEYQEMKLYNTAYLSKIARDYLDLIERDKLEDKIPQTLLDKVKYLSQNTLNEASSWRIIEDINSFLESLQSK